MATIDPWHTSADGLWFDTFAHISEVVEGMMSARGRVPHPAGLCRHGDIPAFNSYYTAKTLPLMVPLPPLEADRVADHPAGPSGWARDNWHTMGTILAKRHGFIDLRQLVPESAGSPVELKAATVVHRRIEPSVNGKSVALVEFTFPYPMWQELPQISRPAAVSHDFISGGTAPISDMVVSNQVALRQSQTGRIRRLDLGNLVS